MSLSNPNKPVTEERLQEFYHKLVPYMGGGSGGGGGHTIEDSEGTELTQRDILQFGEGFLAEDDDTNEKTVITPDIMQSGDMDDVITPLPSVAPKKEGVKYSTTEQVVGEWIDGKPLYQKTVEITTPNIVDYEVTALSISDVSNAFLLESSYISLSLSDGDQKIPINNQSVTTLLRINTSNSLDCVMKVAETTWRNKPCFITIQYTKTTDTPNT